MLVTEATQNLLIVHTRLNWLDQTYHIPFVIIIIFSDFIYFWLCWVLVAAWTGRSSPVVVCEPLIVVAAPVEEQGLCGWGASVVVAHGPSSWGSWALEHGLNSYGSWAMLCGMWDLPGSRIEPMSPESTDRFITPELPGKPNNCNFLYHNLWCIF